MYLQDVFKVKQLMQVYLDQFDQLGRFFASWAFA
jgi:hypothetical protein